METLNCETMLPQEQIKNPSADCEIVSRRLVNAPQKIVYEAWTNPDHLKNWWGPAGFTNTFMEHDLRPGGKWSFIMHGPVKGNYRNECIFIIIDEPNLLVWNHVSPPEFQVVATFTPVEAEKTRVTFRQIFMTAEACNKVKKFATGKNEENFDRLEFELQKMI